MARKDYDFMTMSFLTNMTHLQKFQGGLMRGAVCRYLAVGQEAMPCCFW
jgi:hypothetical protein